MDALCFDLNFGAEGGTRTPTPLRVHGPEPCASANSATTATVCIPKVPENFSREPLVLQTRRLLSMRLPDYTLEEQTTLPPHGGMLSLMTKAPDSLTQPASDSEMIPEDLAIEIRKLAHDLSNALEIIVQTSYLLSTVELKEPATDWLRMLDSGVQKALDINLSLRGYVKIHTPN
jgi:hypothetical protein